jgi:hypothetical protein
MFSPDGAYTDDTAIRLYQKLLDALLTLAVNSGVTGVFGGVMA